MAESHATTTPRAVVVGAGEAADAWVERLERRGSVTRLDSVAEALVAEADVVVLAQARATPEEARRLLESGRAVIAGGEWGARQLAAWLEHPGGRQADAQDQDRLLQAARLADVGQLAGGVAHEINTPLASIALRAESLARQAEDPQLRSLDAFRNFPRYLETIRQETFRCKEIISSLVEFAHRRPPDVREMDVAESVRRAVELLRHEAKVRGAELTMDLAEDAPRLRGDAARLTQVVVALAMNALHAVARGGHVRVSTRRAPGDQLEIVVSDDGAGIAPEILGSIFHPFFTTKPPGQGTGLGLATCHGIVAAHGGEIFVESEPGRGSCFTVRLPARARPVAPAAGVSGR